MSLDWRSATATVLARGDTMVFEINAISALGVNHPGAVERIGVAAAARRIELDKVRAATAGQAVVDVPATFMDRMRRFLKL
jgi:hypothetical protein